MGQLEGRTAQCGVCSAEFLVCRSCDRGQRYCSGPCARVGRTDRQRLARRRHQASPEGLLDHRDRNRSWRQRRRVMDTTSGKLATERKLESARHEPPVTPLRRRKHTGRCHFCGTFLGRWRSRGAYHSGAAGRGDEAALSGRPQRTGDLQGTADGAEDSAEVSEGEACSGYAAADAQEHTLECLPGADRELADQRQLLLQPGDHYCYSPAAALTARERVTWRSPRKRGNRWSQTSRSGC